jgi:hypothetical protein
MLAFLQTEFRHLFLRIYDRPYHSNNTDNYAENDSGISPKLLSFRKDIIVEMIKGFIPKPQPDEYQHVID